jgi:hypothetical protein
MDHSCVANIPLVLVITRESLTFIHRSSPKLIASGVQEAQADNIFNIHTTKGMDHSCVANIRSVLAVTLGILVFYTLF